MKTDPKIINKIIANQCSASQLLRPPHPESADAPKERWSQVLGSSSLDFLLDLDIVVLHCPVNLVHCPQTVFFLQILSVGELIQNI